MEISRPITRSGVKTALVCMCIGIVVLAPTTRADEPCDELDECRVYIEINASDGDIGLHVLFDAEGWEKGKITDPGNMTIFKEEADKTLADQTLTESFFESAEWFCEEGLKEEPDDEVLTLPEFLDRFPVGSYSFNLDNGDQTGDTELTHVIPAAPADVDFDGKDITWEYGTDLGECTTQPPGFAVAPEGAIAGYEVVLEPEEDELSKFKFTVQVPPDVNRVRVPSAYLASLDADTPIKVEVGAIEERADGSFGNQTFTEEDGFCNNPSQTQCPEEEE